jgi:hypothetical protein
MQLMRNRCDDGLWKPEAIGVVRVFVSLRAIEFFKVIRVIDMKLPWIDTDNWPCDSCLLSKWKEEEVDDNR